MFDILAPLATTDNMIIFQASNWVLAWTLIITLFTFGTKA